MKGLYSYIFLAVVISCSFAKQEVKENLDYKSPETVILEKMATAIKWEDFFSSSMDLEERQYILSRLEKKGAEKSAKDLLNEGFDYLKLGNIQKAEDLFQDAIRQNPDLKDAYLGLACALIRKNDHKMAFNILAKIKDQMDQSVITDQSFIFKYRYILAIAYETYKEPIKARKILADLIRKNQSFIPGYTAIATSYLKENKLKAAQFVLQRGLDQGKETADLLNLMGCIYFLEQMPDKAHSYFQKALERESNHVPSLINQSIVYIQSAHYQNAEKFLKKALESEPSHPHIYLIYGALKALEGAANEAEMLFKKAVALDPNSPEARFNLSLASIQQGANPSYALRLLSEVRQLTSNDSELNQIASDLIFEIGLNRDLMH